MRPGDVLTLHLEPIESAQAIFLGNRELVAANARDMELADVELAAKRLNCRLVQGLFVEALQPLFKVLEFCDGQAMLLGAELREELADHSTMHPTVRERTEDRDWAADEAEFKLVLVPLKVHAVLSFPRVGLLMKGGP